MRQYREAIEADIVAICALGEEVNAVHQRAFPHIFASTGKRNRDAAHWMNSIGKQGATTFVAEESGKVVGFVNIAIASESHTLRLPMRFGWVGSVSVTERLRGQGIGRELMKLAQDWVSRHGGAEIRLNVWAFNTQALHMYEELGYEIRSHLLAKRLPSVA